MTKRKDPKDFLKVGRPTKYDPTMDETVFKLASLFGASDRKICTILNIAPASFYKYRLEHPRFAEHLRAGKTDTNVGVANAFLKRAMGYKYKEETVKISGGTVDEKTGKVSGGKVTRITTTKEVPPDVPAGIFWLLNREPEFWNRNPEAPLVPKDHVPLLKVSLQTNDPIEAAKIYQKYLGA